MSFSLSSFLSFPSFPLFSFLPLIRSERIHLTVASAFDRVLNPHLMIGVENLPQAILIDFTNVRLIDLTGTYPMQICHVQDFRIFVLFLRQTLFIFYIFFNFLEIYFHPLQIHSINLSIVLSIYLSFYLCIHLSCLLAFFFSFFLSIFLSIFLSYFLSFFLSLLLALFCCLLASLLLSLLWLHSFFVH